MWKQITTKRYWLRVAGSFLWLIIITTLMDYAFEEEKKLFWTLEKIQKRFASILVMSMLFSYRHREQPKPEEANDDDMIRKKWRLKDFFTFFVLMFLFAMVIVSVLFGIGWLVMQVVNDEAEGAGKIFLKIVSITAVMTFLATLVLFVADRFNIRWGRRF